jgi:hypothetical protein
LKRIVDENKMSANILTGTSQPPTSEDVSIPKPPSTWQWILAGSVVGGLGLLYISYQHFFMKSPGYLSLPNGDDKQELFRALGGLALAVLAIYAVFVGVGTGLSFYTAYSKCQKSDISTSAEHAAIYALNPAISYLLIRTLTFVRRHYDRVLVWGGIRNGIWSIAAFMSTWIVYQTILLADESQRQICAPSADEATLFKNTVLEYEDSKPKPASEKMPPVGAPTT